MPLTLAQIANAEARQNTAARDLNAQVRLVAGPGTGKSSSIRERVRWLLTGGVPPDRIRVVSFTRASTRDLRDKIIAYCTRLGQPQATQVSVSTLHSLALRSLRAAGLLYYPVEPLVLDPWEQSNIHDAEYSSYTRLSPTTPPKGTTPARASDIREQYEAFRGTGAWAPPTYLPPNPPIDPAERADYQAFHLQRSQLYAYVLPGEIVGECVDNIAAGTLDPATLNISHLIVDEYQDLNPIDQQFIDQLAQANVNVFVAGDDDQSIYSFRHASPRGIQQFTTTYPTAGAHVLPDCFRCATDILATANCLFGPWGDPHRIPKAAVSMYAGAVPPESGVVHRWRFRDDAAEATAIAESCRDLIAAHMTPHDIMILIGNKRATLTAIETALEVAHVPFSSPDVNQFLDSEEGRYTHALLRICCDRDDYVAHRVLLGLCNRVGPITCDDIARTASAPAHVLNFRDLFYNPLPAGVFSTRATRALDAARLCCARVSTWTGYDTIRARQNDIAVMLAARFTAAAAATFNNEVATLPQDMNLYELRDYFWADTDEMRAAILSDVHMRLGLPAPAAGFLPPMVRVMTMHGAKGLDAKVVFIPALEDEIFPGPRRAPFLGLVLEAARLLYMSITRARAACILSYAEHRLLYGARRALPPTRFLPNLNGRFLARAAALTPAEVQQIMLTVANL